MSRLFPNVVSSVTSPRTLVLCLPSEQFGWCKQYAEEGYNVLHLVVGPNGNVDDGGAAAWNDVDTTSPWVLITYGATVATIAGLSTFVRDRSYTLRACVHYCPLVENPEELMFRVNSNSILVHLAEEQRSLLEALKFLLGTRGCNSAGFPIIDVYTYPSVPTSPPFPFSMQPPSLVNKSEASTVDPYIRSATGVAYTRTLRLLRRELGPHFDLEKLWENHTYFEFVERDAPKTMATMVQTPYVNHIPTLTGGVGYDDLARFYKYHFTTVRVTPPDTEMLTISRTVGSDRLIDEMIFKCTHTTEIDWLVPGVPPTGRPLEIALVGVVAFRGDKLTFEYWDQASVLVQLGLLDPKLLPVAGAEAARKAMDPFAIPSNGLMSRWKTSEGLDIN